jgi:formamidopyrimidine-DNA glycosylase
MPELPEVETIARGLKPLEGAAVTSVWTRRSSVFNGAADAVAAAFQGAIIACVLRKGKALFVQLRRDGREVEVRLRLGMTGQVLLLPPAIAPDKHTHLTLSFAGRSEKLHFRDVRKFGRVQIMTAVSPEESVPDALLAGESVLFETLRAQAGMAKYALMDQGVLAGMGNIYVDEALHRAGLHPRRRLGSVPAERLRRLCREIRAVLSESIGSGGTTFRDYRSASGEPGAFVRRLRVYGRQGQPCDCGALVKKIVLAGRGTHFCARCQPAPRRRSRD